MSDQAQGRTHSRIEEAYLRLFKAVVVALMSLALLAVVVLIPFAGYQYFQSPKHVAPAQPAPVKSISADDLTKVLMEEERKRQERERRAKELGSAAASSVPASQAPAVLAYMKEADSLMKCADQYRRLLDMSVVPLTESQMLEQLNEVRTMVERLASDPTRGGEWVNAMVPFVCKQLEDPAFAKLRKDEKVGSVFYPSIHFHASAWSRNARERAQFETDEHQRVRAAEAEEEVRVLAAKAQSKVAVTAIGAACAAFMFMALYLIFARIERNLSGIERAVQAGFAQPPASH